MNKKKHISIIGTRGIPGNYGGFETFVDELAPKLVESGLDVTVFGKGDKEEHLVYKGVNVWNIPCSDGGFNDIKYDVQCYNMAREFSDIIYICGYGGVPFMRKTLAKDKRVYVNVDGLEYKRRKWKLPIRWYFRLCEMQACKKFDIVADNKGIKDIVDKRFNISSNCIEYGALKYNDDIVTYLDEHKYKTKGYYLIVARMEPENNIKLMIDGFKQTSTKRKLIIVGNLQNKVYIDSLGIEEDERIIFHGPEYNQDNLRQLRYHSYAYLHGHEVGGTNPSLLEAMGCGNIIIAMDVSFNRYVLGEYGFYMDKDINSIKDKINMADKLDDYSIKRIKSGVLNLIDTKYNWNSILEKYIKLFDVRTIDEE